MKQFTGWPRSPLKFFKIGKQGKKRFIKCVTKIDDEETLDMFEAKSIPCTFCGGLGKEYQNCKWCKNTDSIIVLKNY